MRVVPPINLLKYVKRRINPIPPPPNWREYKDICGVELVPFKDLVDMYTNVIAEYWPESKEIVHMEFGIFNGTSLAAAYAAYKECRKPFQLFAFDSFKGLPEECESEDDGIWSPGEYECPKEKAIECMRRRGVDTRSIKIIEGWYKDTLTEDTRVDLKISKVDVAFIDCDTYGSSKRALDFISPLVKEKILLCFDDWRLHNLDIFRQGEYRAYSEFKRQHRNMKEITIPSYNRKSHCVLLSKL